MNDLDNHPAVSVPTVSGRKPYQAPAVILPRAALRHAAKTFNADEVTVSGIQFGPS